MQVVQNVRRPQIRDLDTLPLVDRSLIDYSAYHRFIGHAGAKHSIAVQATRGCPYRCFYCDVYKTAEHHKRRSVDSIFNEVRMLHDIGIRRIEFIDDIFNVKKKDFVEFFERVLKHNLDLSFYFPTGLRGDLLDHAAIDLMVEAGAVGVNLSLEHAAPRMQTLMGKHLDVDSLRETLSYITQKHPSVILTLNAMHGFPTETEEEAMMTLDFIRSVKWIDFAYLHNVRIFPGTELETFALQNGVSQELIHQSQDMSYHESSPTLPFSKEFSHRVRTMFVKDYVLNRERLLSVIPRQLAHFSEDELNQKYNGYFPSKSVQTLDDVLRLARISREELNASEIFDESKIVVRDLNDRIRAAFGRDNDSAADEGRFKLLLVDFSSHFTGTGDTREYNVLEPPLGCMALVSYLNLHIRDQLNARIIKPRIDFNSYEEFVALVEDFGPDLIGVRAMTFYQRFMHDGVAFLKDQGVEAPVILGGPYASESYLEALADDNVSMCVIGEGEETLLEIVTLMIANDKTLPPSDQWATIAGIAYRQAETALAAEKEKVLA